MFGDLYHFLCVLWYLNPLPRDKHGPNSTFLLHIYWLLLFQITTLKMPTFLTLSLTFVLATRQDNHTFVLATRQDNHIIFLMTSIKYSIQINTLETEIFVFC